MADLREHLQAGTVTDGNGCWLWQRRRDRDGYGHITVRRQNRLAHRVAYEAFVGPIPAGLTIDHLCRTPACINPAHLEPVTVRENILRGGGVTARAAAKTHCKRGHLLSGDNLAPAKRPTWRVCKACRPIRNRERRAAQ